jgi:hypothetical protein
VCVSESTFPGGGTTDNYVHMEEQRKHKADSGTQKRNTNMCAEIGFCALPKRKQMHNHNGDREGETLCNVP